MNDNYRKRLTLKLRALIAVLEVALSRVQEAKKHPEADLTRLDVLSQNLLGTLGICHRAIHTIEKNTTKKTPTPSGAREYTEMTSVGEYQKFKDMPPISMDEVQDTDVDELIERLLP